MLCDPCIDGQGGTCRTPGCALWAKAAPDAPLAPEPFSAIERADGPALRRALEGPVAYVAPTEPVAAGLIRHYRANGGSVRG